MSTPYLLPHLVEAAADRDAGKVAVRCRDASITYGGLATRARALASTLQGLGVGRGDRVGILCNKSIEAVVAVHGSMGAGAAYVPIDPLSPAERVEHLVRDAGIEVLVSEPRHAATVAAVATSGAGLRAVVGDGLDDAPGVTVVPWDDVTAGSLDRAMLMEQDLCYVLYTSGSTGTPKGIMHTHRSALSWANVSADTHGITSDDVISNYAPLHFDLSTLDLFAGPRAGATMVMVPEEHMRLPASLARLLADEGLTLFYTVPMALVQLARPGLLVDLDLSALTRVLFGGEPMPVKHLAALATQLPHTRFVNVYGPTEVNGCTHHTVTATDLGRDSLPIGRPYPNVDLRVVDDDGHEVADGETGQLLVRAATSMKGYWDDPERTDRAFVLDERFAGQPDRFHATGDHVHRDTDGLLWFHGRRDRQLKVRGNRVELDEVEALLQTHDAVRECAVFALRAAEGPVTGIGAAAIVEGSTTAADLRRHLAARLPKYAVPTTLELMDEFPRTTSGKIHRRELAAAHDREDTHV